ncbi:MAG: hypothetical protein ACI8P3_002781 [Saprospiraceae bacterium]|jgi:hypothetical protein
MKFNKSILFSLAVGIVIFSLSCKNDDEVSANNKPVTFENTCCQIPHLEACVGGAKVFVPNAFTANEDGVNDIFIPYGGDGVKEISSFKIFNENEIVFEVSNFQPGDQTYGWDGRLPDGTIEEGIFTYTISITNINNETVDFDGAVCCRTSYFSCVDLEKHCVYGNQQDYAGGFDYTRPSGENCQ